MSLTPVREREGGWEGGGGRGGMLTIKLFTII